MKEEISIRGWVKRGIMIVNTSALDGNDPDHPYNQALSQDVCPEDFGLIKPISNDVRDALTNEQGL